MDGFRIESVHTNITGSSVATQYHKTIIVAHTHRPSVQALNEVCGHGRIVSCNTTSTVPTTTILEYPQFVLTSEEKSLHFYEQHAQLWSCTALETHAVS